MKINEVIMYCKHQENPVCKKCKKFMLKNQIGVKCLFSYEREDL